MSNVCCFSKSLRFAARRPAAARKNLLLAYPAFRFAQSGLKSPDLPLCLGTLGLRNVPGYYHSVPGGTGSWIVSAESCRHAETPDVLKKMKCFRGLALSRCPSSQLKWQTESANLWHRHC